MQAILEVTNLPADPADAASAFTAEWLVPARRMIAGLQETGGDLLIVMPPAGYRHGEWRLATARMLAREAAPIRVNLVATESQEALVRFAKFLAAAPGITGHYLPTHFQYARRAAAGEQQVG